MVIALTGGEIVYFELDNMGQLNEYQERKEISCPITCLALGPVPPGRQRSSFVAVGCSDNTVRVLSLDPETCLQSLSMQAINSTPESICIVEMMDLGASTGSLYVYIGLQNGVLIRTLLDNISGLLTDSRLRFLGPRPVRLCPIKMNGGSGILALSSRPWVSFTWQSQVKLVPLSYPMLEFGSSFCSEPCPEGLVVISGNTLRIIMPEQLSTIFHSTQSALQFTPRKFIVN